MSSPADMITDSPAIEPWSPWPSGSENPDREGVGRVDRREDRTDQAEHVRRHRDDGAALALGRGEHLTGSGPDRRGDVGRCGGPVGMIGPAVAAAHSTSAASSSVSIAYCAARSLMIMSRIAGDDRLMSCFDTLT